MAVEDPYWCSGGTFTGKDPTKVHRNGAYIVRQAVNDIVSHALPGCFIVQESYVISVPKLFSLFVNTNGTGKIPVREFFTVVMENCDFRPGMILINVNLKRVGSLIIEESKLQSLWHI